jgi:hypothetical protein
MAIAIMLMVVALASGYIGSRIERRRSSSITKREATELRRDFAELKLAHYEHFDAHKVIKYQIEGLATDIVTIGQQVGLDEVRTTTKKRDFH